MSTPARTDSLRARIGVALCTALCTAWLASTASACQVGREIVGMQGSQRVGLCGATAPDCDDTQPNPPALLPPSAATVDLSTCAPQATGCSTDGSAPVTGGDASCETEVSLDDDTAAQAALAQQICSNLHIVDDRTDPRDRMLRVDGSDLEWANITIESTLPLTIELYSAKLLHVWFDLHGPVTLHIEDSQGFDDVRVSAPGELRAALELEHDKGKNLAVGTDDPDDGGRIGLVSARRSTMQGVLFNADTLELESTAITNADIDTDLLNAIDATFTRVAVVAQRTVLSSSRATSVTFMDTEAFSAIDGTMAYVVISDSAEGTRLFDSTLQAASLEGHIVLDHSGLAAVRLGQHQAAQVEAWDSSIRYARFCSSDQSFTVGGETSVECSYPRPDQSCDVDVCTLTDSMLLALVAADWCEAFVAPPACALPEVQLVRPPSN